ncbi:uncharacterized protein LOC134683641 [Mytilus trossulus]|uniref:uncharacterized protein LOC134683641 n=1 Tax=Mytilus trossulus TaxID=6551 RepID=UPI0030060F2D
MAAPTDQNNELNSEPLICSSQPVMSLNTPAIKPSNKRKELLSPELLPGTQKQTTRQIRRRNSVGDLREIEKKIPAPRKSIADKVLEALSSPDVINKIVPILAEKIGESFSSMIEEEVKKCVDQQVKPIAELVEQNGKRLDTDNIRISRLYYNVENVNEGVKSNTKIVNEIDTEVGTLFKRIADLETRLENQEQYSRRTSLRFHNIRVPIDPRTGKIPHPINTDIYILQVCNSKLGLNLTVNDIGRSHVIGKVKNGKSQVIVRFLSYRTRSKVYTNKKALKGDADGIFITENLTQYRTGLTQKLADLKYNHKIFAYWTSDGRIFAKTTDRGTKKLIKNYDDITALDTTTDDDNQHLSPSTTNQNSDENHSNGTD